ncbi:MAG TPA: hypothetical protein VMS64_38460 [Candidatus Methylomirabilis sp.]|nr:hypothetical protein [Candidatus Methylomirabilis sp.]
MLRRAEELVDALAAAAAHFTASAREEKLGLLDQLAGSTIDEPRALLALHETLCFLQAYPDDARVLASVDRALGALPARVARLPRAARRRLEDSGIAGTSLTYPFGLPMTRWLAHRFPRDVDIVWTHFTAGERLEESLVLLLHPAEHDAWSDEGGLGWRRWLDIAKSGWETTDLQVILGLFDRASLHAATRDWLFDSLELDMGWRPGGAGASRTFARLPWPRPFFHGAGREPGLERLDQRAFRREVLRPLPSLRRAPRALAHRLIDAARLAMATRQRELFAFSYPNPDDVLIADPGRGLRIALIGLLPHSRLAYDGYYAYLALKNGVPVGYGAGWQLFGTLEFAANVFESFRRGESAFIVSQVLRAYHQSLGMRMVLIDPYQIGRDNPEALSSGAFYFYRHLGFRSVEPAVESLAGEEEAKIARDARYRTPLSLLTRLARSDIFLSLQAGEPVPERRVTGSALATLVTRHVARDFRGDRRAAVNHASARVARALGVRQRSRWPADEQRAFEHLALVMAHIPDLSRWPAADRRRLVQLVRAKGGPSEAGYVRRLDEHPRLRQSLEVLVAPSAGAHGDGER